MIELRRGRVVALGAERPGAQECTVELDERAQASPEPALCYPAITGPVTVGAVVIVNATAVSLDLGTGGVHFIVAVEDSLPLTRPGPGKTMKARYTPLQVAVETVEETHAELLDSSPGLLGTPVVAAPLHSMIAHVAAGAKVAGAGRVIYVMTDGSGLLGGFSRLVPRLRDAGLIDGWITCGQAFGGELEAVNIWSALIAAKEVAKADVIVVADGPGNLGTETRLGTSNLLSGVALNAAGSLGGRPVAALRVSFADPRPRHHGVSHHSLTILSDVTTVQANVAVPTLEAPERHEVWKALRDARLEERHRLVEVLGWPAAHRLEEAGVEVTSMGRSLEDDPIFFLAAGGAGILAGRMAAGSRAWQRDVQDEVTVDGA